MKKRLNEFTTFMNSELERCSKAEKLLIQDDRKDEANLMKVEANIYMIFQQMFELAVKNSTREQEAESYVKREFRDKLERIPQNWLQSLAIAKAHDDAAKVVIEEIKLQAVGIIKDKFNTIWGENI